MFFWWNQVLFFNDVTVGAVNRDIVLHVVVYIKAYVIPLLLVAVKVDATPQIMAAMLNPRAGCLAGGGECLGFHKRNDSSCISFGFLDFRGDLFCKKTEPQVPRTALQGSILTDDV